MSDSRDKDESDEIDFSWGKKKGRGGQNKEVQFYESFTYDGEKYSLYDSVYLFKEGEARPYIGKLIKIWEHSNKSRKVKVLWFFYPLEISNYLIGENTLENELFLASGCGKGLANVNPLETIAGKCNVLCISKDERNRQPLDEEVKMAHYVFYRTFDVQTHTISDKLGERIAMIEVNFLLNKSYFQSLDLHMVDSGNVEVGLQKSLVSDGDTLMEDGAVSRKKGVESKPNKLVGHPQNNIGVGLENMSPVMERKTTNEDQGGANEIVGHNVAQSVNSLDLNARNGLKKVDSGKICFEDSVPPGSDVDDNREKELDKREKELAKDDHKAINDSLKQKSEDKQAKKLKVGEVGGTAPLSSGDDGTSTLEGATTLFPTNASKSLKSESEDRGRPSKKHNCASDGFPKKLKLGEKSSGKVHEVSLKQIEDKHGSASLAAKKPSHSTLGDAETDDKGKVNRQMIGTSNGLLKKLKSNVKVEDRPNDKITKVEDKSNGKLRKIRLKEESKDVESGAHGHVKEVTQRPLDRSKWFTARPWEERMKEAYDQGRLVLLHNLDPTYASSDVENIVWNGFNESCTAKVIQHTLTSCQHSGQAFIICKTKEAANKIVMMLDRKCLMLPSGRPVLGSREGVRFPGKHSPFPGHLVIDKLKHQMQREAREAVSTSHSSQPNTIEYEMALEWRLLQDRSELWWKMMYKKQAEATKKLKATLKSK